MSPFGWIAGLLRRLWKATARLFSAPQSPHQTLVDNRPRPWSPAAADRALRELRAATDAIPLWLLFDHDRAAGMLARVRTTSNMLELAIDRGTLDAAARAIPVAIAELRLVASALETRCNLSRTLAGDSDRLAAEFAARLHAGGVQ